MWQWTIFVAQLRDGVQRIGVAEEDVADVEVGGEVGRRDCGEQPQQVRRRPDDEVRLEFQRQHHVVGLGDLDQFAGAVDHQLPFGGVACAFLRPVDDEDVRPEVAHHGDRLLDARQDAVVEDVVGVHAHGVRAEIELRQALADRGDGHLVRRDHRPIRAQKADFDAVEAQLLDDVQRFQDRIAVQ